MRDLAAEGRTMLVVTHEMGFAREGRQPSVFHQGAGRGRGRSARRDGEPNSGASRQFLSGSLK